MESYKDERIYDYTKSFINNWGAIIFILIAIVGIILVGSLSGFKEIKAKKSDSSRMIKEWRDNNESDFPEEYIDIINYDNKNYYFVVEKFDESGKIISWYFAYDSDLTYVFSDSKYWILTFLTIFLSLIVYDMNSKSTLRKVQDSDGSKNARNKYAEQKMKVMDKIEYLDYFFEDEYNEIFQRELRDIVRSVDVDYETYLKEQDKFYFIRWYNFGKKKLLKEKDMIMYKKIKYINKKRKKIDIQKLRSQDVIQDNNGKNNKKIVLLPEGADEFLKNKMKKKVVSQVIMTLVSGLTVTFGIALGDWTVGIAYAFTIISSGITAIIVTTDYARTTLRQRDIARTNYLKKYENKISYYENREKNKKVEQKSYPLLVVDKK